MRKLPVYSYWSDVLSSEAANAVHFDLFNASGSGKVIHLALIEYYHKNTATVNGVTIAVELFRTTSVGTGGTVITPDKVDTLNPTLPSQITARVKPTAGATVTGNAMAVGNINSDETSQQPNLPFYLNPGGCRRRAIRIREGEGVKLIQGPFALVGKLGFRVAVMVQ